MPLACKANALPSELHPLTKERKGKWVNREEKKKKRGKKGMEKNSPTGIRTPVFHVTGEDTEPTILLEITEIKRKKGRVGSKSGKKVG